MQGCAISVSLLGMQGWRSGDNARLPPLCPGFDSRTQRHCGLSLLLVVFLAREVFLRVLRFNPLSSKINIPKFQFDLAIELSSTLS